MIRQQRRTIAISHPWFAGNEKKYVNECLDDVWISSVGHFIGDFERAFEQRFEVAHAVSTNNGTTALHLTLVALGIGPGDEVIVPTLTYVASANAVRYCGATPVFVDSEPQTWNLDPADVAVKITPRTRAIMVVHLYGHPADMDPILALAREHGLFVVEDAAEALGARYKGRLVGGLGDVATFSFFGNKVITTGEGGMVTTQSTELEQKLRLFRGQGMDLQRRYWFPVVGYNYRMTNIEAALGLAQIEKFDEHFGARARIGRGYAERLSGLRDRLDLPVAAPWAVHSYWIYTVALTEAVRLERDDVMAALAERGIETRPAFYPMHVMPPYLDRTQAYPVAERLGARGISLPTHALLADDDLDYITQSLRVALGG